MSRRDTIIISVLVNAVLLAVLFTTAITKNSNPLEEQKIVNNELLNDASKQTDMLAKSVKTQEDNVSSLSDSSDIQKQFVSLMQEKEQTKDVNENKASFVDQADEKIIYKLPEIAKKVEKTDEKVLDNAFEIIVKSGDTLERIAKNNHVRISEISSLNNLQNSFLRIGQKLLIPKNTQTQKSDAPSQKVFEKKSFEKEEFYTVKVGDNPYTIALKHSIKPHELLKLNNLDEKKARRLKPGDKLRIR